MINPSVEIDSTAVLAAFNRRSALASDPRAGLDAVGRVLKIKAQLGFESGTDPYGKPWAPLKSRSGQPLRDKGDLMGSYLIWRTCVDSGFPLQ